MNYYLYINISSIYPWIHIRQLNRTYCSCSMPTEKVIFKNIMIHPFAHYSNDPRARGTFVYEIHGDSTDKEHFFYSSIDKIDKFLNYLTLYCRHGFMAMDNYIYTSGQISERKVFDENRLLSVAPEAIYHEDRKADIAEYIAEALENAHNPEPSNRPYEMIANALSLYRASFFQSSEGVRYVLRFTALESMMEYQESAFKDATVRNIISAVRCVCKEEKLSTSEITKICSHVGQLRKKSIRNTIKDILNKYHITIRGKEVDVDILYEAKNRFGHKGVEVDKLHRLSIVLEDVLIQLLTLA